MRELSLDLDGRRIEAAWWGSGAEDAPTLVLLHEGLGSVGLWRDFPALLAQATGCGVLAYSRFGYGRSASTALPRPLSYMHDEADAVLGRVLDATGIRSCFLLGHSDGASIATIYAGGRQDRRLRGVIVLAPHFFVEDVSIVSISAALREFTEGGLRARLARHHDDVDVAFFGWNGAWLDPAFRSWDILEYLAYIRVPILLLQGEDDAYGTLAQVRAAEREVYCPLEVVLLPGVGHSPHRESPDVVVSAVGEFVYRVHAL